MEPADLARLVLTSDPQVAGARVAHVRTRVDLDEDRYLAEIWLDDRRLTAGPGDSNPRWAPDGARLAFLRAGPEKGAVSQVAVIAADGGEARVVTSFELGVEAVEWCPDGSRLVVVAVGWVEEGIDDEERARRPRRITRVPYRFDGLGPTHDRRRHLWLIDPDGEITPRCLTPGDDNETNPAWSPDGRTIAFLSDRLHAIDGATDVWEVDVEGGEVRSAGLGRGMWELVGYRPDGLLHALGRAQIEWPVVAWLYRREPDGSVTALTEHLDRSLSSPVGGPARVRWQGDTAVTGFEDSGRFGVVAIDPDGAMRPLVEGDRVVTGFDCDPDRVVFTAATATSTGELYERSGEEERPLTALGSATSALIPPEHFRVASGDVELDVWVYLPEGDAPVPVLLNIHGGPSSQYGFGFHDEFQVYAGAGMAVVATNPRGSSGRGEGFVRAVVAEGWGVVDEADVLAALDAALERHPRLDPARIGVMGGSYGGFLTAWLIARHRRFRSAVVERALLSWNSFAGTSDIGGWFAQRYTGAGYPDGWATWWEKSPLSLAEHITTPTLIVHSDDDHRCPPEQAEQLFLALLHNGTPTEMLRFPGEGHELSRSGRPRHRVERFEAILDWHRKWLE
jgi:dipeptidyl aminopeptidase/acylaminoacyl peptidase